MSERLPRLRQRLAEKELDAILISQSENRRYLSGFTGSAGFLLISASKAILAADFRYVEQTKGEAPDFEIVPIKGELKDWSPELVSGWGWRKLGFEADSLTFTAYGQLLEAVSEVTPHLQLAPTRGLVEGLRAIKEPLELELIRKAVELADAAAAYIQLMIRPGILEKEIAWEVEKFLREKGSESLPFNLIIASGPNSALPHAQPSERALDYGEPVLIDIGARLGGYTSDLSRTLYIGDQDETFAKIYDIVLGAELTAIATLGPGMSGEQVDQLGRAVIEQAGYGENFGHGLGHGVGLAGHEQPRLGPKSTDTMEEGMVFTIEPGIYLSGWGGVRIEDVVLIEKGKARVLSRAEKIIGGHP